MVKYRIFNNPEDQSADYWETLNFEDVPEGAIEGYNYIVVPIEEVDPEEVYQNRVSMEYSKYYNRIIDGQNMHSTISAQLRMGLQIARISEETHDLRVAFYLQIREDILSGWQDKALIKLDSLGNSTVGEVYFNELYSMLSNYVNASFDNNLSKTSDIGGGGIKNPKP